MLEKSHLVGSQPAGYLSGYNGPTSITDQLNRLRSIFPGLGQVNADYQAMIEQGEMALPSGSEGWFCVPDWTRNPNLFGKTYAKAVLNLFRLLKKDRRGTVQIVCERLIDDTHWRQLEKTVSSFEHASVDQKHPDVLIIPAQFGKRYKGVSSHHARARLQNNEYGLGSFAIGCMVLTHMNRLADCNDIKIDCVGDAVDLHADKRFEGAPGLSHLNGNLILFADHCSIPDLDAGSVTAFLPM